MQFSVTFRHMDATEALKSYAKEKLSRIWKYLPDPIAAHVTMSTERHLHRADVTVQLHNGIRVAGHESTEDMYSAIDLVMDKIERQVKRYKDKLRTHKGKDTLDRITWTHSVVIEGEEVGVGGNGGTAASPASAPGPAIVKKTEKFHADPMSVASAIMQLNLTDEQFLVFRSEANGGVSVVYRRDDGSYGLIETPAAQ
ncbi:MAG TPA: ribosome-associated translation inhibitor RaiA [Kofleriaceae bacterium]|jgi:putative sigma-54 modulation protein|nr:ribosome-associated translation inhibitor RaiA [Kofleriaceae bacterium]